MPIKPLLLTFITSYIVFNTVIIVLLFICNYDIIKQVLYNIKGVNAY